jgi:hypothetical protein
MSLVLGEVVGQWVCEKAGGQWTGLCQAIGWEADGELVCGIMYDSYTGPGGSVAMHSRCDAPEKVSRKWLWAIFDYPFNHLAVKRVAGLVPASNLQAQRTNEHLGWKRETTLADYFPDGDGIVYIMRRADCRWLRLGARFAEEPQA